MKGAVSCSDVPGADWPIVRFDDFGSYYWSPGRIARANQRTTAGSWEVSVLAANWQAVVATLACPVLSLFGFNECGAELVEGLAPRFTKL